LLLTALAALALQTAAAPAPATPVAQPAAPPSSRWTLKEADFVAKDVRFRSGETMASVRLHYGTLGTPHRDASGRIDNAVMVLHGTGGSGRQFLQPQFADQLYGPGQPLDIRKYWIILPDNIGHGASSKPSDGLHMRFPQYGYDDMVMLQHRLLTEGLGLANLRLLIGTSMGCMHAFQWGETYPGFARALMPLACQPVAIAGLNRMWRQLLIDGIKADPAWAGGEYKTQPLQGLRTASSLSVVAGAAPLYFQKQWPTHELATEAARERVARDMATRDANDMIYQFESSRTYDPWPGLEKITVPLTWINSADDFINPRNFTFADAAVKRMPQALFRMIAETDETRGHGTHTWAVNYLQDLNDLLARSEK
jgi:homoserine O-acetyltransferase/O-succinyltransferase